MFHDKPNALVINNVRQYMHKLIYIASIILLFALGWFSHIIIRGDYSQEGKKYTQATAVIFTPIHEPSYLGMRGMARGDSQKRNR